MRWPRLIKPHSSVSELALSIDIAPTLLELGNALIPQNLDGRSLVPLLKGKTVPWRAALLIEYWSDKVFPRMDKMGYKAVRTDRWKYIHYVDLDGMDELYDLKADPYELTNLIQSASAQQEVEQLRPTLRRLTGE
jgi:arylsulfatase A-like enzyme